VYLSGDDAGFQPWTLDNLLIMIHAPYEGGGAPSAISGEAQNPSINAGDPVETVTDWSGNANHLTQATLSRRPTWEAGAMAGVAGSHYYDFDGSDDRWTGPITLTEEAYVAAVVDRGIGNPRFFFHWGVPSGFSTLACLAQTSSTSIVQMRGDSGSNYGKSGVWATGGGIDRLNWYSNITPSEIIATIDDVDVTTSISGTPVAIASKSQTFDLGSRGGGFAWDGSIGSFFLFSAKPTDDDIAALNAWCDDEWS
jgi:hypothetical protein